MSGKFQKRPFMNLPVPFERNHRPVLRNSWRDFSAHFVQNPAFSVEDSKVSVATCTATTQMASIFRICGTAGSSPAIFMSKEGTKPRQVESTDLSTG